MTEITHPILKYLVIETNSNHEVSRHTFMNSALINSHVVVVYNEDQHALCLHFDLPRQSE